MLPEDKLHWGMLEEEDFMLGPNFTGQPKTNLQRQIASNISQAIDKNSTVVAVTEKARINNGSVTPGGSSASRRGFSRTGS